MLRLGWRNLRAHKLRLVLSGLAVLLGVAFVAGTYVFTDTLQKTFDDLFSSTVADVEVRPLVDSDDLGLSVTTMPEKVLDQVRDVDGVAKAEGSVLSPNVYVLGKDGKVIGSPGAPAFGASWSDDKDLAPFRLINGRGPTADGEVALDRNTADKGDYTVGDTVRIVTPGPSIDATVVGIFNFGNSGNLAGATLTGFDLTTARDLFFDGKPVWTAVSANASDGVTPDDLATRVNAAVGTEAKVQTGQEVADEQASDIQSALSFINIFLLVFAGIALFVSTFIIFITFSMLVAQRSRELALLRAMGAKRSQVVASVAVEAFILGIVASALGLFAGIGLAKGLKALFAAVGASLDTGPLVVQPRTVIVAFVVGILVTTVVALFPALRASRIPPVAAMRDDLSLKPRALRLRTIIGLVISALGAAALLGGVSGSGGGAASLVGVGALLTFIGLTVLSPAISRPVVGVLGTPFRSATGRMAVRNAQRDRRRTAATASALMIGLALVATFSVLGASVAASVDKIVDDLFGSDLVVSNSAGMPFTHEVATTLAGVPGIEQVSVIRQVEADVTLPDGSKSSTFLVGVDPDTVNRAITLDGDFSQLGDGMGLDRKAVEDDGLQLGDLITVTVPTGTTQLPLTVIYDGADGVFTGWLLPNDQLTAIGVAALDSQVYAFYEDGADPTAEAKEALAGFPMVQVQTPAQFKEDVRASINVLLRVIYALLGLAIIVAILGIINTLALSVIERTREIGLLRAVGTTRRQMRRMVVTESVVIAVYGALLGIAMGIVFGVALQRVLRDQGIAALAIPWGSLVTFVVLAAIVGVLAALWPARRAARLDVLRAIATE